MRYIFAACLLFAFFWALDNGAAMKACLAKHSQEVCSYAINR